VVDRDAGVRAVVLGRGGLGRDLERGLPGDRADAHRRRPRRGGGSEREGDGEQGRDAERALSPGTTQHDVRRAFATFGRRRGPQRAQQADSGEQVGEHRLAERRAMLGARALA